MTQRKELNQKISLLTDEKEHLDVSFTKLEKDYKQLAAKHGLNTRVITLITLISL